MKQKLLFDLEDQAEIRRGSRSGSFVDNMKLPIHRWFRYSAGFSAEWAREVICQSSGKKKLRVLDPFAGSGTVVLEAERAGSEGIGVEAHPFVARVAQAKLLWREDPASLRKMAKRIVKMSSEWEGEVPAYPPLIAKCYPPEILAKLDAIKHAYTECEDGSNVSRLCWLAFISILRSTSPVGTAQWQYILPNKTKARTVDPVAAFEERIAMMTSDMLKWQQQDRQIPGRVLCEDARELTGVKDDWADLVVTSPPYANNYDYADATRLEMTFLGEISGWGDLQSVVRQWLIRSCTQHVSPYIAETAQLLKDPLLYPIAEELIDVCHALEAEKENHGGKKQYHAMIAHYFLDLAKVWKALRRTVKQDGRVCFVIGDSAPYGVYVPVDRWLGELALAAGFKTFRFEKIRDRNTKWKNRKHTVPLHEGRLWVEG